MKKKSKPIKKVVDASAVKNPYLGRTKLVIPRSMKMVTGGKKKI